MTDKKRINIKTDRLLLRPMEITDIDDMLRIFTDPPVLDSFGIPPFSRYQMESWVQRNLQHQDEYGYGLFSVILSSNDQLIGDCGLEQMKLEGETEVELGYDFLSEYWHQGYATEAAKAVCEYAFGELNLPRLVSLIRVGNDASIRVAERIGMNLISEITRYDNWYWQYGLEQS